MSVLKCEASSGERMSGVREEEVVYPEQLAWILKEGGKQAAGFSLSAPAGALKECLILKLPPPLQRETPLVACYIHLKARLACLLGSNKAALLAVNERFHSHVYTFAYSLTSEME